MLKIRLQRVGRKHEPVFRLVLTESTNGPRNGKALEVLGSYDSRRGDKAEFQIDKIKEWLKKGVQLSPTVHNILVGKKVLDSKKINVLPPSVIAETKNKKLEAQKQQEEAKREAAEAEKKAAEEAKAAEEKANDLPAHAEEAAVAEAPAPTNDTVEEPAENVDSVETPAEETPAQ